MFKEGTSQVLGIRPNPPSLVHRTSLIITETCSSIAQSSFELHYIPTFIVNSWVGLPLKFQSLAMAMAASLLGLSPPMLMLI